MSQFERILFSSVFQRKSSNIDVSLKQFRMLPKFCRRGNNENFEVCLRIRCVHVCYVYCHALKKFNLEVQVSHRNARNAEFYEFCSSKTRY